MTAPRRINGAYSYAIWALMADRAGFYHPSPNMVRVSAICVGLCMAAETLSAIGEALGLIKRDP